MIVLLCRGATRLVALVLLPALGLVALAFAAAAVLTPSSSADLAGSLGLTSAWGDVGRFLQATAPAGNIAAVLGAAGAVLLGLVGLVGALAPAKAHELALPGQAGLAVRPRALRQALQAEAAGTAGATSAKVRLRTRRRGRGGRAKVRLLRARHAEPEAVEADARTRVAGLAEPFALKLALSSAAPPEPRPAGRRRGSRRRRSKRVA